MCVFHIPLTLLLQIMHEYGLLILKMFLLEQMSDNDPLVSDLCPQYKK